MRSKYRRLALWRRPATMLLSESRRPVVRRSIAIVHQPLSVSFSPSLRAITTTLVTHYAMPTQGRDFVRETTVRSPAAAAAVVVRERGTLATMLARTSRSETFVRVLREQAASSRDSRTILERVRSFEDFVRTLRVDSVPARTAAAPLERVLHEVVRREERYLPPVARVAQKKTETAPPQPAREDTAAMQRASEWAPENRPFPQNAQPAFPSLETVADHVMNQLDRRMVAWRERMGRI